MVSRDPRLGDKTIKEHEEITTLKVRAVVNFVRKEGTVIAEELGDGWQSPISSPGR